MPFEMLEIFYILIWMIPCLVNVSGCFKWFGCQ